MCLLGHKELFQATSPHLGWRLRRFRERWGLVPAEVEAKGGGYLTEHHKGPQ